jgi:hypothetical protein
MHTPRNCGPFAVFLMSLLLGGCGTRVPDFVVSNEPHATAFLVNKIINHVKCELRYAVRYAVWYDLQNAGPDPRARRTPWIDTWGAKLAIKLVLKEKGSINPGASLIEPLANSVISFPTGPVTTSQNFAIGMGANAGSQVTRIANLEFFFDFASEFFGKGYNKRIPPVPCKGYDGAFEDGDLKIADFVDAVTFPYFLPANVSAKPPTATSQQVEFLITYGGNLTPSLKLVRFTGGTSTPVGLFAAERSHTSDLIVSLGPTFGGVPSRELDETHFLARQQSSLLTAKTP